MKILEQRHEIKKIIEGSSNIFIIAHNHLDLDAINSCIAFSYYLKVLNKISTIIVDETKHEDGVQRVLDNYLQHVNIKKSKEVKEDINDDSLLVVLDTNKEKLLQNSSIMQLFKKILNIDHHDYKKDSIKATVSVVDEDASSTTEMLTALFEKENISLNAKLATLLLAGIVLDTNNFQLMTNVDTFYYSYRLAEAGGSIKEVNDLFKQNLNDYIKRQKIITSVKKINGVAIGKGNNKNIYNRSELAKTADMLLTFKDIRASFAIGKISKDEIGISARSNGSLNVGKLLEKYNGGGDENEAAAVIENSQVTDIYKRIVNMIK